MAKIAIFGDHDPQPGDLIVTRDVDGESPEFIGDVADELVGAWERSRDDFLLARLAVMLDYLRQAPESESAGDIALELIRAGYDPARIWSMVGPGKRENLCRWVRTGMPRYDPASARLPEMVRFREYLDGQYSGA